MGWGRGWGKGLGESRPAGEPASHPSGVSPGGVGVQVEHGLAPAVDSQRDTEDADDVHHYSGPGLRGRKKEEERVVTGDGQLQSGVQRALTMSATFR